MGVINQGILGGFSGKVGPVVGGKWKDIDYMRSYVVPANPNTSSQQTVRAKFSALVATARLLLTSILQPFWDPFLSTMSGFNSWISQNYAGSSSAGVLDEDAIMSMGTLQPNALTSGVYSGSTVTFTWTEDTSGNADSNDYAVGIVYDISDGSVYFNIDNEVRGTGSFGVTVGTGKTATNLMCYLFMHRGTGSELIVSDSRGVVGST